MSSFLGRLAKIAGRSWQVLPYGFSKDKIAPFQLAVYHGYSAPIQLTRLNNKGPRKIHRVPTANLHHLLWG